LDFYKIATTETEKTELVNHLTSASASLKETVSNLTQIVDVQNKLSSQKIKINIKEYLIKTIDVISGDIKQSSAIINIKVPTDLSIEYNPSYLESIFLNFITNGVKYRHPSRQPELNIFGEVRNGQVVLEFEDNGIGIDLQKFGDKLFGMYKTFHGNTDAKGIGLFLTKNQVEVMGGRIEVTSSVGVGTKFTVFMNVKAQ
jgi:signal transduction histidine kinase